MIASLKIISKNIARILILGCGAVVVYLLFFVEYDSIEGLTRETVRLNLEDLGDFLEKYKIENGKYPEELEKISQYYIKMPVDPWGDSYIYRAYDNCFELSCCLSEKDIEEKVSCRESRDQKH